LAPGSATGTDRSFSAKWNMTPPEDRRRLAAFQQRWFLERFGFADEAALADHLACRGLVLDAGTGLGYDAARYARLSSAHVVGLDITDSVDIAARDFGGPQNLHFVQGDLETPPFAPAIFDLIVADQVIHHTTDCARTFATLATLLAPGGELAVYVYRRKALIRELADDHVRALTSAMSVAECLEFSEAITELGRALSDLDATVALTRGIPLLGIPAGEHHVQRLLYWCFLKCFWNEELGWHSSVMTNFDWYHPPSASRHTEQEVRAWCMSAGLAVVHLGTTLSGISVRARRN